MSTIINELLKATGATKQGRSEDDQDFFERIMVANSKLSDDEFDELSEDTQDWCNEASVYINKRKDVPPPADWDEEEEKPKRGRRRGSRRGASDDDEEKPKRGSRRGSRRGSKSDDDGEEDEKPKRGGRRGSRRGAAADGDEEKPKRGSRRGGGRSSRKEKEPEGPVVGEEISFADITEGMILSNVDGELEGEVIKKVSRSFTLATDDGEEKITKTQAKGSILEELPDGDGKPEPEEEEDPKPRGRGRGRGTAKPSERGGRGSRRGKAKDDGDDTAVGAIRKIMLDDPDMTIDEVGEALEDDGVDFKAATLKMTYETFVAHYEMFAKAGLISD